MIINYELTKEDYVNFQLNHIVIDKKAKASFIISRILMPGLIIAIPFLFAVPIPWQIFLGFGLFYAYYYPKFFNKRLDKRVKRILDHPNNKSLIGKRELELTDDNIFISGENLPEKRTLERDEVFNLRETNEYFFLYTSPTIAYIIPKRAFSSIEQQEEFKDEIETDLL